MKKWLRFLTMLVMALAMSAGTAFAAEYGGVGGAGDGDSVAQNSSTNQAAALNTLTGTTTVTSLIRVGQVISTISRASNVVTVVLTAAYPNSNLVAGQSIVISGVAGFNGTFTIAAVASQTQFTYAQTADNATGSVDATSTAGGHYTTLTTWEADRQGDITAAGRNTLEVAECYNDWTTAEPLTDNVTLAGWTTDSTHYVKITTPTSERHKRLAGTGFALRCSDGTGVYAIRVSAGANYTVIQGLEIKAPATLALNQYAIYNQADEVTISDNLVYGFSHSSGSGGILAEAGPCYIYRNIIYDCYYYGIQSAVDNSGGFYIYNNIVYDCSSRGIRINRPSYVYNNTVYSCTTSGISTNYNAAYTVRNNLCIGNGTDYDLAVGTITASNNISSDATAPGTSSLTLETLNDVKFVSRTLGYEDYRIQPDSVAVGAGTSTGVSAIFTDDCDQHTRVGWDVGADEAAKEFICSIRAAGATSPAPDYNLLSTWESGCDDVNYTLNTTRVFSGAKTGTVADAASVTLYRGGASQSVTGTAVHAGASQILVKSISNGAFAFTSGDQWRVGGVDTNMFQITDAGDTAALVAECYNDWPSGLDDNLEVIWSGGATEAYYTDSQHALIIRAPLGQRHNGTAHTGFYLKPTSSTVYGIRICRPIRGIKIQGIEIDGSGTAAAGFAGIYADPYSAKAYDWEISSCLIHDIPGTTLDQCGIKGETLHATAGFYDLKVFNNIIYNCDMYGMRFQVSGAVSVYNNTVYNCNLAQSIAYGIRNQTAGSVLVKNNIVISSLATACYFGTFAAGSGWNCSSDGTATSEAQVAPGTGSLINKTADNNFNNAAAGDFTLKSTADAKDTGAVLTNDSYIQFSTDIVNNDRGSTKWSMGAAEYMTYTWQGDDVTAPTDWAVAANWDRGAVPTTTANVTIPDTVNEPAISAAVTVASLTMTGGSLTLNANLTTTGDITCSGGTLIPQSYTINCGGNLNLTGSTFTYATSTINMNAASGTKTIALSSTNNIYNMTFSGAATFQLPATVNVYGDTWTRSAGTIDATTNNSTVTFYATSTLTGSQTFNNLTFDATSSNRIFTIAAGTTLTAGGTLTISGNRTVIINGGNISAQGNVTVTNTYSYYGADLSTTIITLNGTGNQTLTGSGTIEVGALPNIVINKASGNLILSGIISARGNWTFTSMGTGSLITTGSTLAFVYNCTITGSHALNNVTFYAHGFARTCTIAAGTTLTVGGTLTLDGDRCFTFNTGAISAQGNVVITAVPITAGGGGTATVTLNGTGVQSVTGTAAGGQYLSNITINKTGSVTTSNVIVVAGDVTVTSGTFSLGGNTTFVGNVTVASGGTLACTTPGTTVTFTGGKSCAVDSGGYITFQGASGSLVTLARGGSGTWALTMNGGYLFDYVQPNYSAASVPVYATNSPTITGCTNWNNVASGGGTTATWDGSSSTAWNLPVNWDLNRLPTAEDDVVIPTGGGTNKPTIPAGAYSYKSFTATAGAYTITCLGDTTAINADSGGTASVPHGIGVTINTTGAVSIGTGVTMSANAQGFAAGEGPGSPANDGERTGGGGYGNFGGNGPYRRGGLPYGSVTLPTALGSGGGINGGTLGGAGAGAIKINASGTATINGTISAAGANTSNNNVGGGAGGSIWIIADTLAGSGAISANGGSYASLGGGGSGGRIKLTWTTKTYTGTISASGGTGTGGGSGHAGTLSFPDNAALTVNNSIALAPGTYNIPTLTVTNNATLECQGDNDGDPVNGSGVIINATTVTIDSGAAISANGLGFKNSEGPGTGVDSAQAGGGGHGGAGGAGGLSAGGSSYGSPIEPISLGSGGGDDTDSSIASGGYGGGAVKINATGTVTINGSVLANGDAYHYSDAQSAGGSGGSAWVIAGTLAGTGSITANGGDGHATQGGGGGGGRIAVQYSSYNNTLGSVSVAGGTGVNSGTAGTIVYSPIGGYTAENVLPAAQCVQSTAADGLVTVTFKVKDPGDAINATTGINNNHTLKTFEYSVDGGSIWNPPTDADSSESLAGGWPNNSSSNYTGASTFDAATGYSFTLNTKHANLTGLNSVDQSDVKIRFKVKDTVTQSSTDYTFDSVSSAVSASFIVDNAAPAGLASLAAPNCTSTSVTLTWTAASDTYFNHYEIWYGTSAGVTRVAPNVEWDNSDDANLATAATATTTITGLTSGQTYYFKIWAVDNAGNETTIAETSKQVNNPPVGGYSAAAGDNVIPAAQVAQAVDGTGNVVITYKIKDPDADNCSIKAGSFEYQVAGGGWSAVLDADVSGTKSGLSSAAAFDAAVEHTLTWASKQDIDNTDSDTVQVRFTINDSKNDSISPAASASFSVDNVYPALSSWTLNMNTGSLAMTFGETIDASETAVTGIILQNAATASGGNSYTLIDSTASQVDSTTITVTLSAADLNAIKALSGLCKANTSSYIRFASGAVKDLLKNNIAAVADGSAVQVTTYTADSSAPTLSNWTLNMNTQTIQLTFSEPVGVGTFDATKFTVQDTSAGTNSYALTGTYSSGTYASLTAGQYAVGGTSNLNLRIKLSTTDFNALMDHANIAQAQGSSWLVVGAASGLQDVATAPSALAAVAATNASTYTANTVPAVYFRITTTAGATSTSMTAGGSAIGITLSAMDANLYRTPAYGGSGGESKTIVFSGASASPDGNAPLAGGSANGFTTGISITFTKGIGSSTVRLYNRESALIAGTDSVNSVSTPEAYRLTIAVSPEAKNKLAFTQQPSATGTINVALAEQPIVQIRDTYGNRTDDTDTITLYDSTTTPTFTDGAGTLANAAIAAVSGNATFSGLAYNRAIAIYLRAMATGLTSAWSASTVTLSTAGTSTVDAADAPVANFNLSPINDTEAEKFAALKFKVTDAGADQTNTLIDRIRIAIGGTGANASTDIAWAGLYKTNGTVLVQTASAIANDYITFGSALNSDSSAALDSVTDNTSTEYTLYIYMKNSKLTATDAQTYTFGVNEGLIGADGGTSSQIVAAQANVATVTGTIAVTVSYLEVVTAAGASTLSATAGTPAELRVRGVDANRNVDIQYGLAPDGQNKTLRFSGLSSVAGNDPLIEASAFDTNITIEFLNGLSATNGVTLTAYKKETQNITVQDYTGGASLGYSCFPLAATVESLKAATMTATSGDNQVGKTSQALPTALLSTATDTYGNVVEGANVTFAITAPADGATLSVSSGATNSSGQLSTTLTLGTVSKTYTVTATATGPADKVEGTPSVSFTATGRTPTAITKTGDNQSQNINTQLTTAFTARLVDAAGNPIPNETISFSTPSVPTDATGYSISAASGTTDSDGQASTTLTLGNKTGAYIVRATYSGVTPNITSDFTGTATTTGASTVTVTGPSSITAGGASSAFTISITDDSGNAANVTSNTVFNLTENSTGNFYSDSGCTAQVTTATVASGASSAVFYYKQDAAGSVTVTATRASGQDLTTRSTHSLSTTVVPADLHHFVLSGDSAFTAGVSTTLTIGAYDVYNNLRTNFSSALTVRFRFNDSAAHSSPAGNAPTCGGGSIGNLSANGSAVSLTFTSGSATAALILYKPETAVTIKAYTDSGITTPDANDLEVATVIHNTADHTKLTANLPTPQEAGVAFGLGTTLTVTDAYDNICDGANGGSDYDATPGTNNVTWTLSGTANAPDGGNTDSFTRQVNFNNGVSTTTLNATLYRAQATTLTASVSGVPAAGSPVRANQASNEIIVSAGAISGLWFSQEPSSTGTTDQAFAAQPSVSVADQYGNATSAAGSITLAAYLNNTGADTSGNGTLTSDSANNTKALSSGVAAFTGMKYSYPEAIYLKATVTGQSLTAVYSNQITLSVAEELTTAAVTTSSTISSIINAAADRAAVYAFTVTDAGADGRDGGITRIIINRDYGVGGADTAGDWTNYINSAAISDGTTQRIGTVAANSITFGDATSTIYTVSDGTTKTFTLRISLSTSLPAGADAKVIGFTMDANNDISLGTASSTFAASSAITGTATVAVVATDLVITGEATMDAGASNVITITAKDVNGNTDAGYHNIVTGKALTFSGANASSGGNNPTCSNYGSTDVAFGSGTDILFTSGVGTTTMKLYRAETVAISVTDGTISTASASALSVSVGALTISSLSWSTQPAVNVVTNAPWRAFVLAAVDTYGNTITSSAEVVTISLSGSTGDVAIPAAATETATISAGLATFNNFYVSGTGTTRLSASSGAYSSAASSLVTVAATYTVNVTVNDSFSSTALTDVTLQVTQGETISYGPTSSRSGSFSFTLAYGTYTFGLTKEAYVDAAVESIASTAADGTDGAYDNVINWTLSMTSITEATADYKVMSSFVYDEDGEDLIVRLWLERRGILIVNSDTNKLGSATLDIYDSTSAAWLTTVTLAAPASDDYITGTYTSTVSDVLSASNAFGTALTAGKSYFAKCKVNYGGTTGTRKTYEAGATFSLSITTKLSREIITKMGLAAGETVASKITAATTAVGTAQTAITSAVTASQSAVTTKVTEVKTETAKILTAAETTIPDAVTTAKTAIQDIVKSEILNRQQTVKSGGTITMRYRTYTGLSPKIDVYDADNTLRVNKASMTEIGTTGVYERDVKFLSAWSTGDFTIVCSESTKGSLDAMTIMVLTADIESISSQISGVQGATSGITDIKNTTAEINSQFSALETALGRISSDIVAKVTDAKTAVGDLEMVYRQLVNISGQIKGLGATKDMDLGKIYEVSKEKKTDIMYLKNKTQELKAAMDLNQKMIENVAKKPVVQTWFEFK